MPLRNLPVQSSAIARLDYDDDVGEAYVSFHRGGNYTIPMSEIEAERWASAASPGGYFNEFVKGKY